ncbi:hypothetical protein LTR37_006821 [Vermiconidia calcicola]|uniref:Uncharacterized protein n=1 Tax=Vermiconidia calcicola TaxID=1690605 RepID=A0ACC3NFP2_9PEZI|nr:hypothetical protein LTR37_006821 [Vermiconidia calcicola]
MPPKKTAVTKRKAEATTKAAPTNKRKAQDAAPAAAPSRKRKAPEPEPAAAPSTKRKAQEAAPAVAAPKKQKTAAKAAAINEPSTQRLNVFVCGEGGSGELGLGTSKKAIDVKRPRLNPYLAADKVGAVKVVAGGMHALAITHDNKIISWGVNDQGALGRDTQWEGGLRDVDAEDSDSDDENDDNGLNPKECIPDEVDFSTSNLPPGTRFTDIAAGDSCSFALTDTGFVYGWGVFRKNDGIFGFINVGEVTLRPVLVPGLSKITSIKSGANHALALDSAGLVFAWGNGQQGQLGRRVIERTKTEGLTPRQFGLPKGPKNGIASIECGSEHSFAISKNGTVYAWGLNNFGETGIRRGAGEDSANITNPTVVESLKGKNIISIKGGGHHSIAATKEGDCLVWGRMDGAQMGIAPAEFDNLPEDAIIRDPNNKPRILILPQKVDAIESKVATVTASSDHCIAITQDGKAYSWGFSANYQTGQGVTDDIDMATMIDNTAVREQKLQGATSGGQFSILTAGADGDVPMTNGF